MKEQEITKLRRKKIFFHFVVHKTFPVEENKAIMKKTAIAQIHVSTASSGSSQYQPVVKQNKPTDKQNPTLSDYSLHSLILSLEKRLK